jgi:hypothetical protein
MAEAKMTAAPKYELRQRAEALLHALTDAEEGIENEHDRFLLRSAVDYTENVITRIDQLGRKKGVA